jgi:RNA polymerase sigma-70 factor (ECF subfamily)
MDRPTDGETFAAFYEGTLDNVYRTVLLATRHEGRAEDAVHEAYLRAYERWADVARHPNPQAWVTRVALNVSISGWRIWRREQSEPPAAMVLDDLPIDPILVRAV